jgi:RNA-directed DNA polymerase
MEKAIRSRIRIRRDQVNFIRYADDFVVTARTKETLEQIVKPAVVAFLAERGLELSEQKTTLTHIEAGFNFLGQNVRKYKNKLVIKPARDGLKALVQKTRECIKGMLGQKGETLIKALNPLIRTAERIIRYQLLRWARRTHPNKSYGWLKRKYFSAGGSVGFAIRTWAATGESAVLRLYSIARTVLDWHIKVRGEANPYDPVYTEYFERRRCFAWRTLPCRRTGQTLPAGV